jgi:spore germination protein YaaH
VRPGRRYVFVVRVISPAGKATKCAGSLHAKVVYHPPFPPHHLGVRRVRNGRATITWSAARRGDGPIAGYRVFRDGKVYRQTRKHFMRVQLPSRKTYRFWVATADTRGRLSKPSKAIRVRSGHRAPPPPSGLRAVSVTDSQVGLAWSASRKRSARVVAYRLYRNGAVVRQVRGLSGDASNLAPATGYRFTVAAVDSLGYLSDQAVPLSVTTAMPPPTRGRAHAFLLASTSESFRDFQRHYMQIGTVYPTYFDCRSSDAGIRGSDDALVTRWSQLRKVQVLPRFDCQNGNTLHTILTNSSTRSATIAAIVSLVQAHSYDGINIDFESGFETDRDALTSFASALAQQLHALGKKLSIEVSATWYNQTTGRAGFYDYAALGAVADTVFVMNWGWHWTTSGPGPPDEIENVTKVADYVTTMPNRSRYVLGIPLYVQDWPNGGGSGNPSKPIEYGELVERVGRYGGLPVLDPTSNEWHYSYNAPDGTHDAWFGDATTIATRLQVTVARGLGVGLWRLGREDQRIWSDPLLAPSP